LHVTQAELDALYELKAKSDMGVAQLAGFEAKATVEMERYRKNCDDQLETVHVQLAEERERSKEQAQLSKETMQAGSREKMESAVIDAKVQAAERDGEVEGLREEMAAEQAAQVTAQRAMAEQLATVVRLLGLERSEAKQQLEQQREEFEMKESMTLADSARLAHLEREFRRTDAELANEQAKRATHAAEEQARTEEVKNQHEHETKERSIVMRHTVGAEARKVARLESQVQRLQAQVQDMSADAALGRNQRRTEQDFSAILAGLKQETATVYIVGQENSSDESANFNAKSEQVRNCALATSYTNSIKLHTNEDTRYLVLLSLLHTHACTHIHTHIHTCTQTPVHTDSRRTYIHTYIHIHTHLHTHTHTYTCTQASKRMDWMMTEMAGRLVTCTFSYYCN
jgi:hypothetical protein